MSDYKYKWVDWHYDEDSKSWRMGGWCSASVSYDEEDNWMANVSVAGDNECYPGFASADEAKDFAVRNLFERMDKLIFYWEP
jgi:hypothetical protein